jgi:hypothetical protein
MSPMARHGALRGLLLGSALLAGCAGQPTGGGSDFGQVNLAPGKTAACYTDPCTILFTLPPGKGPYEVRANNQLVGTYPAGQVANLGDFFRGTTPDSSGPPADAPRSRQAGSRRQSP